MKSTPAHTSINPEVFFMIPETARKIVDVGCMLGQMAFACKELKKDIHYTGIEINPEYANIAANYCDEVFVEDIENLTDYQMEHFIESDCWIFGDCLEHLKDPWEVLKKVRKVIRPNGCVVICIPNTQHWSIQTRLLSGQFWYENYGLLDRTHLRFFTKTTLIDMFQKTGWKIEAQIIKSLKETPEQITALQGIQAFAEIFGIDPETAKKDSIPFQYVFKLIPNSD